MAIIINQFEIIVEEPLEDIEQHINQPEGVEDTAPTPPPLRPEDIASVIRFYQERAERLIAD